ncbi:histidine phosphatase family protein [Corynebacterium sp. USCH3]|uniref:histidine phosphatase family protein n=1 Tax=Corynebacterium sp. USCH3 TaxID=3024840 RepID=UPI0030AB870D
MAFLYLVRHGQAGERMLTGDGRQDAYGVERAYDVLSDRGHRQAAATGRSLARRQSPGATVPVLCGPLHRQRDTAAHVAEELGASAVPVAPVVPVVDEAWREFDTDAVVAPWLAAHPEVAERMRQAEAAGRTAAVGDRRALAALTGTMLEDAMAWWVDRPDFADFRTRVLGGLGTAARAAREDGTVVVVTSAGVIALCVVETCGLPVQAWPGIAGRLFTASVSLFRVGEDDGDTGTDGRHGVELLSFNEHAHLDEPGPDGRRPLRRFS